MIECALTLAGIVVPSALVILAVRRWLEPVSWRMAALFLAIVLVFIARGVFTRDMPVPLDEVVRGYPYRGIFGEVKAKNALANDITKQILPWMHVAREEVARGRAPLWNRHLFCGYPLLGNGQSAPFSPVFLATLFVPLPKQLVAMAGLKLFVALLFGFLLLKREGVGSGAAVFGSGVFAFAILNCCFLYYPLTSVTLMLPVVAYAALRTLDVPRAAPMVLLALSVVAILAGGHPESAAHIVLAVIALVIVEWLAPVARRFTRRDLARVVIGSVAGVLIAAPAWVPVLEQALISLRVVLLARTGPLPPMVTTTLWALANPDGFGNPARGTWNWFLQYPQVASIYFGMIVMVLVPGALLSRQASRRDRLLVVVLVAMLLIAFGWTPLGWFFAHVWPFTLIAHERLLFVCAFVAGIVAARAVARLRRDELAIAIAASCVAFGFGLYVLMKTWGRTTDVWSTAGVAALALFWIGAYALKFRPAAVGVLAGGLTLVELFIFTFPYNAMTSRDYYAPRLPIIDALKARAPKEPFRIAGLDWMFLPNAAAQYGLEDIRGTDPMEWAEYVRFFSQYEVKDQSIDFKRIVDVDREFIDFLNVRFLLTEPGHVPAGDKWQRVYSGRDGNLYENRRVMPRFLAAGAAIDAWMDRPTKYKLRISAPARTFISSSQPAVPGWRVRIGGRAAAIVRVRGAFIGFFVPAGESRVTLEYVPWTWYGSLLMAALAAAGLAWIARRGIAMGG
ncbi:MAG TPA: YfhO family protein [Thermoanaerobaculia bacterium]|nr:YfhO family protein [Thermoanaerobaculia bacterium]